MSHHDAHGVPGSDAHGHASTAEEPLVAPDPPPDEEALTAIGACLAVLVAVVGVLLAGRPRRRWQEIARRLPTAASRTAIARARDPVAPCLHRLSIQRC